MATIPLTRGKEAIVDDADYEALSKFKWYAHRDRSGLFRAYRHVPGTRNTSKSMTEELLGKVPGMTVDHANRDPLDNRRANLRRATHLENNRNRIRKKASGLPPGIFKNVDGKYTARITITPGVRKCLGTFQCLTKAFEVYKQATITYFGDFSPYKNALRA